MHQYLYHVEEGIHIRALFVGILTHPKKLSRTGKGLVSFTMRAEDSDLSQLEALGAKNWLLGTGRCDRVRCLAVDAAW